jgi:hypothetical protein
MVFKGLMHSDPEFSISVYHCFEKCSVVWLHKFGVCGSVFIPGLLICNALSSEAKRLGHRLALHEQFIFLLKVFQGNSTP